MTTDKMKREAIEHYISTALKEQLEDTTATAKVAIEQPFILVYLSDFILPTEEILLKRSERKRLLETRDMLLKGLIEGFKTELKKVLEKDITTIYADWNLESKTGMLIAVMDEAGANQPVKHLKGKTREALEERIIQLSEKTQKKPDHIEIYQVDDYAIVIERTGIMVDIEKELIKNGATKELRMAKRLLEHRVMNSLNADSILNQNISELFLDWDFEKDKAYMVLVLESWLA